jgi:BAG domain
MPLYSSLPVSLGYSSHLQRRPYRPTSFYPGYNSSPALAIEELEYPPFSYTFPSRIDPEMRYRRALYELQDAEQGFEAHIAFERAHHLAILRRRAAAEAESRERALILRAEIERIEHAQALQAQIEEYKQREDALQDQAALVRAPWQQRASLRSFVDADIGRDPAPNCCPGGRQRNRCRPTPGPARHGIETTLGEIIRLFAGIGPEPQSATPLPTSTSPVPSQEHPPAEPKQPSAKPSNAQVTFGDILEFFHSIATQAKDAANDHNPTHEVPLSILDVYSQSSNRYSQPNPLPQPEAIPVEEKTESKGKAKAVPVPEPSLFQTLLPERMQSVFGQELRDIQLAIQLSLQERDAADAKKAHATKARHSSPGASSSKVCSLVFASLLSVTNLRTQVKVEVAPSVSSGRVASPTLNATAASVNSTPSPAHQPVTPLTAVRSVRTQLYAAESSFKFPAILDFDQSVLAVTPDNAPVRAYKEALNGFLGQLDAIESDGDEEVRNIRREVVREVEKALEDVESRVRKQAPQVPPPEVMKDEVKGYDVEGEEPKGLVTQGAPLADAAPIAGNVKLIERESAAAASPIDADVDLAIFGEYDSAAPVVASSKPVTSLLHDDGDIAMTLDSVEVAATPEDVSDSIATITATPAPPPSPGPETFLTSISHDQFTFPPKPVSSSSTSSATTYADAVLVDNSDDGESVKGGEDGWSEVDG